MSKNTIKIDGAKLKNLLEYYTKKSLYDISEDEGFSRNFLSQACRSGKASPIVQAVARKYGVEPEQYKLKDKELKQMSIEDLQTEKATKSIEESRKAFVKLGEAVNKYREDIRASFIRLTEEWNKAIEEYNEKIKRIKEGK